MRRRSILRRTAPTVVVLMIAACGASNPVHRHASSTTIAESIASTTPSRPATVDFFKLRGALVTMKRYSPLTLMWQTVSVKQDGSALLTTLIGELSGSPQRSFQLPAGNAAALRRLVARARSAAPPPNNNPRAQIYTLYLPGRRAMAIQGSMPRRLAALVRFLGNLMFSYCC